MNSTIHFLLYLRRQIERGQSVLFAAREFTKQYPHLEISRPLRKWSFLRAQKSSTKDFFQSKELSLYQRHLFLLLERSANGEPIHAQLILLEEEMGQAIDAEIQRRVALLPLLTLFPLLFCQFPAVAGVILWPFLENLFHSLS